MIGKGIPAIRILMSIVHVPTWEASGTHTPSCETRDRRDKQRIWEYMIAGHLLQQYHIERSDQQVWGILQSRQQLRR